MNRFISEFCAPVVVLTSTGESEAIALKNGLLLHELLSAFGHLDGISATVRGSSANFHMTDAHIRFERETEVRAKTPGEVDALLQQRFEEFDLSRMPATVGDMRSATPSAWSLTVEQIVMRSMSFSEFEMISHPLVLMTVVATSDLDPVACMQQLASVHHTPQCMLSGQFDPDIHRLYLLIHDASNTTVDPNAIYRKLIAAGFPQQQTKYLALNSLPPDAPNLQQPDMWSRWLIPKYFPNDAPSLDPSRHSLPTNPADGTKVLCSLLSMEDFMALREFCVALFHKEIVPALEKRIGTLTKQVNEARKGVKNVLKSFWRKPREETGSTKGALRYRYDRIESQILLLADTSLSIKDYDTAASMYKLVRDDYRSDKSQLHLAHTALMLAICQWIECTASGSASGSGSAGRSSKDLLASLEALREVMQTPPALDPPHSHAHFALLASELYASPAARAPLAAAEFLLHSAGVCGRFPLLSGLLGERAAACFLQAGLTRKFSLHVMLAGQRMRAVGPRPRRHSLACYVAAMVVHDTGRWDGIKTKLSRAIAEEMKHTGWGPTGAQRSLLILLKLLAIALGSRSSSSGGGGEAGGDSPTGHASALAEASAVLAELQQPGPWGSVSVADSWSQSSTRQLLLGPLPMTTLSAATVSSALVDVEGGLPLPSLSQRFLSVMLPANGIGTLVAHDAPPTPELQQAEELRCLLALERQWGLEIEGKGPGGEGGSGWGQWGLTQTSAHSSAGTMSTSNSCADLSRVAAAPGAGGSMTPKPSGAQAVQELLDRWVTLELDISAAFDRSKASGSVKHAPRIPLGEPVVLRLQLRNRLPVELSVSQLQLQVVRAKEAGGVEASGAGSSSEGLGGVGTEDAADDTVPGEKLDVTIAPFASIEVLLSVLPPRPGTYCAQSLLWNLSPHLRVRQQLFKSGALLQKTLAQRSARERTADTSVSFEVVAPHALLRTSITGLSSDALQGELSGCSLVLRNEGRAPACDIAVKFNHPCCVLLAGKLLAPFGQSATVTLLPTGTVIAPGAELTLAVWARLNLVGRYPLTAITAYSAGGAGGLGAGTTTGSTPLTAARVRTSVVSVDVNVAPSLTLLANVVDRPSSTCVRTVVLSLSNVIQSPGGGAAGLAGGSSSLPPPPKASISVAKPPLPAPAVGLGGVTSGPLGGDEALRPSSVVIEGIYLLGAAVGASGAGQGSAGLGADNVLCAAPGERLSFCLPVSTPPSTTSTARPLSGHCTWLLPLRPELTSPPPGSSAPDLEPLVAQSLCQLYATVRLHRLLREARAQYKEAEADEGGGPRSLQQVRRDKDKERERERELLTVQGGNHAKSIASSSSSNVHTADSANFATAFSADDAATAEARGGVEVEGEGEGEGEGSLSSLGVPLSATDLAALEARQGNVNLTIVWSCLWKGAVRRGVHSVSQISLFSGVGLGPVMPRPSRADAVLVGISHPSSAVLSVESGLGLDILERSANGRHNGSTAETSPASRARRARVPVLLELRSVSEESLCVDVEAVEAPDLQGGVRWEGKVAYAQVLLAPMSSVVLPFFAVVSKAGVFDLKRFTVVVTSPDGNGPTTKLFSDNSFIQVVDDRT